MSEGSPVDFECLECKENFVLPFSEVCNACYQNTTRGPSFLFCKQCAEPEQREIGTCIQCTYPVCGLCSHKVATPNYPQAAKLRLCAGCLDTFCQVPGQAVFKNAKFTVEISPAVQKRFLDIGAQKRLAHQNKVTCE